MMTLEQLKELGNPPTDIGGYQAVVNGKVKLADIIVYGCLPGVGIDWANGLIGETVESVIGNGSGVRVYRKIPVAHQGDIDHGQEVPSQFPVSSEHLSGAIAATHDEGKPPLAYLPWDALDEVAMVQEYGHVKYGSFWNYRKGIQVGRNLSCAIRHIRAYMNGENNDKESQRNHLAHAACRLLFTLQNLKDGTAIDDRYVTENKILPKV